MTQRRGKDTDSGGLREVLFFNLFFKSFKYNFFLIFILFFIVLFVFGVF